jgi:hypothetical protein
VSGALQLESLAKLSAEARKRANIGSCDGGAAQYPRTTGGGAVGDSYGNSARRNPGARIRGDPGRSFGGGCAALH